MLTELDLVRYANVRARNLRALRRAAHAFIAVYDRVEQEMANHERVLDPALQDALEDKREALASATTYEKNNAQAVLEKANRRRR